MSFYYDEEDDAEVEAEFARLRREHELDLEQLGDDELIQEFLNIDKEVEEDDFDDFLGMYEDDF